MDLITLIILSLGLAMDAFSVSVSNGLCYENHGKKEIITSSLTFGIFQGLMPIIGYFLGNSFYSFISNIDHWIALILLVFIGGKMIYESFQDKECQECGKVLTYKMIFVQGIATSIDALAVGISFAALDINIYLSAFIICIITIICCLFGSILGHKFGSKLGSKAEVLGGIILIIIGIKIFIEHMFM